MASSAENSTTAVPGFSESFPSAFVTGGSSGLGRVFVEFLHREGVEVWAGSRSAERLKDLPKGVKPVALDLSDRQSVAEFLQNPPWERTPALLFNNAGYGEYGRIGGIPPANLSLQLVAMLESAILLSRHFVANPGIGNRTGVVNVSSLAVEFPLPFLHGYNAVKAGLSGFSRSLALEFPGGAGRPFVIDLRPGDFRTSFNHAVRRDGAETDPELQEVWQALEHHLQHGANPEKIWAPVRRALLRRKSETVRVGTFFQARLAPFFSRILPESLLLRVHRGYYKMRNS